MNFVYPTFLWALGVLIIPILIHLFHFRRYKKVFFTNVKFLQSATQESQQQRKLKHWLVLITRCFALACLVLAFAQPFVPLPGIQTSGKEKKIAILLDNSFSMRANSEQGPKWEVAKESARNLIKAHNPTDAFYVLSHDFLAGGQQKLNASEAIQRIDELEVTAHSQNFNQWVEQLQLTTAKESQAVDVFWFSDFQKEETPFPTVNDSNLRFHFAPIVSQEKVNISVDSAWLNSPVLKTNEPVDLYFTVKNHGERNYENLSLKLQIDQADKNIQSLSLKAGETKTASFNFSLNTEGWHKLAITLADDEIVFDDALYLSLFVRSEVKVQLIGEQEGNKRIAAAYQTDPYFNLTTTSEDQVDYSTIPQQDLIILSGINQGASGLATALSKYVQAGGNLFIWPNSKDNGALNKLLNAIGSFTYPSQPNETALKVGNLNLSNPLFEQVFETIPKNIDLPEATQYYSLNLPSYLSVIKFRNGQPFMVQSRSENKGVFAMAIAPGEDWSNFSSHGLFVPILLKLAVQSGNQYPLYATMGKNQWIPTSLPPQITDLPPRLVNQNSEIIPAQMVRNGQLYIELSEEVQKAGNYLLKGAQEQTQTLAINYNRSESVLDYHMPDSFDVKVKTVLSDISNAALSKTINEQNEGKPLWPYFIMGALLFLLIEILLLRLLK